MTRYECANAVRLYLGMKHKVEDTIARYLETELKIYSPVYITVSLYLDELNQVTEMHTSWKTDLEVAYKRKFRMTFSQAIGIEGRLCRCSQRNSIKLNPFFNDDIVATFRYFLARIPILGEYLTINPYQTPPNYNPMKLVVCLHPDSDEGKNLLARFITDSLGQSDNDWFALRLNLSLNRDTGIVHGLYIGTGWVTPQWAEVSDRGPSFAEKSRFQTFFTDWFKEAGISPSPATSEAVVRFFEMILKACPNLNEHFAIIEK